MTASTVISTLMPTLSPEVAAAVPAPAARPPASDQFHESAVAQVAGAVHYIDDLPRCAAPCTPRPFLPHPCARQAAGRGQHGSGAPCPAWWTWCWRVDIPGDPMLAAFAGDEPVFALDTMAGSPWARWWAWYLPKR